MDCFIRKYIGKISAFHGQQCVPTSFTRLLPRKHAWLDSVWWHQDTTRLTELFSRELDERVAYISAMEKRDGAISYLGSRIEWYLTITHDRQELIDVLFKYLLVRQMSYREKSRAIFEWNELNKPCYYHIIKWIVSTTYIKTYSLPDAQMGRLIHSLSHMRSWQVGNLTIVQKSCEVPVYLS